ncbi:probable chitinase 10 isoform X2 [Ornithodoros turicata]|uniref:probable chitinase 10 isoform X2 n=1 Tax=Ornithodoros turicata TaxID=34597 RepID=UPI00313912C9
MTSFTKAHHRVSTRDMKRRQLRDTRDEAATLPFTAVVSPASSAVERHSKANCCKSVSCIISLCVGTVLTGLLLTVYYYLSSAREESRLVKGNPEPLHATSSSTEHASKRGSKSRAILACYYDPGSAGRISWTYDLNSDFKHNDCTHIMYQGIVFEEDRVIAEDEAFARTGIPRFVALKRPGLTVMASLRLANLSSISNRTFVPAVTSWVLENGFEGLDVDIAWDEDASRYNYLVDVLDKPVRDRQLILSVNVYSTSTFNEVNITALYVNSDFLVLNTYNLTFNQMITAAPAPLYGKISWNSTIEAVYKQTKSLARLIPTISFMSRQFELDDEFTPASRQPHDGMRASYFGPPGIYTNTKGLLAYYEVCSITTDPGWVRAWQNISFCFMFAKDNQVVIIEDETSISCKVAYLMQHYLAGVAIKHADLDAFKEKCNKVNPLFQTVLQNVRQYKVPTSASITWRSPDLTTKFELKPDGTVECYT